MWKLWKFLIPLALIVIPLITFAIYKLLSPHAAEKTAGFCKFISPLVEYNLNASSLLASFDGHEIEFNVINPKTKNQVKMHFNQEKINYNLDEREHIHKVGFLIKNCECLEEMAKNVKNSGSVLTYFTESVCQEESCYNQLPSDELQRLNELFLKNQTDFCSHESAKGVCQCTSNVILEAFKKYFSESFFEQEKEPVLEEPLSQ